MSKSPIGPSTPQDDVLFPIQSNIPSATYKCPYCGKSALIGGGHADKCRAEIEEFMNESIDSLKSGEEE